MSYTYSKIVEGDFQSVINQVTEELKKEGFGIITQINMKDTLKNKLDVEIDDYMILGACNPGFAYQAITTEEEIGTMLPCNVVIKGKGSGKNLVSAVDPAASMMAVKNDDLSKIAGEVGDKLKRIIANL